MSIPNTATQQASYFVGLLAHEGPSRVDTAILKQVTVAGNEAYPGKACTYNADDETVAVGGEGVFAGLILGNERVPSDSGEGYYANGDKVELVQMGEMSLAIDLGIAAIARNAPVHFDKTTGQLGAGAGDDTDTFTIKNAVIVRYGDKTVAPCIATVSLTGPV